MTRGTRRVIGAGTFVVLALVASGRTARAAQDAATAQDGVRGDEPQRSEYFGRMFHLPPFAPATPAVTAALARMGARERVLDARDHLAAGPVALIVDPLLSVNNPTTTSRPPE